MVKKEISNEKNDRMLLQRKKDLIRKKRKEYMDSMIFSTEEIKAIRKIRQKIDYVTFGKLIDCTKIVYGAVEQPKEEKIAYGIIHRLDIPIENMKQLDEWVGESRNYFDKFVPQMKQEYEKKREEDPSLSPFPSVGDLRTDFYKLWRLSMNPQI